MKRALLTAIITFTTILSAFASHAMGADIMYDCLGNGQYQVTVNFYRDCSGISQPSSIDIAYGAPNCNFNFSTLTLRMDSSSSCHIAGGLQSGDELDFVCGNTYCNGGVEPGTRVYSYCGVLTLPFYCSEWIVGYRECCRNSLVTNLLNPNSYGQYVYAIINNENGLCNNSPRFNNPPITLSCTNNLFEYTPGAIEPDGDSIVYRFIQPMDSYNNPIPYVAGLSLQTPAVLNGNLNFDPLTGVMSFIPVGQQFVELDMLVEEYRNGVFIGSVLRDIQHGFVNCTNAIPVIDTGSITASSGTLSNQFSISSCIGEAVSFDFTVYDVNLGDSLNYVWRSSFQGVTPIVSSSGFNPVNVHVEIPVTNQAGNNWIQFDFVDNACLVKGRNYFNFSIETLKGVDAGADQTICATSDSVQLNATLGGPYTWQPVTGLSNPNIANPKVFPQSTTTYVVTGANTGNCPAKDTITVYVVNDSVKAEANGDTLVCKGEQVMLSGESNKPAYWISESFSLFGDTLITTANNTTWYYYKAIDPTNQCYSIDSVLVETSSLNVEVAYGPGLCSDSLINIMADVTGGVPPFNYQWSNFVFTSGMNNVLPGFYQVTVTDSMGCETIDGRNMPLFPDSVEVLTTSDAFCGGNPVELNLEVIGGNMPCPGGISDVQVGFGNQYNSSATGFPAIYGHFYKSGRTQMIYQANELIVAGLNAGEINSIAFNVGQLSGTNKYCEFTISMKSVSAGSLVTFNSGLTTVFNPKTVYIDAGWNQYGFDQSFFWDGTSNIIVDVCFNRTVSSGFGCDTSYSRNSSTYYSTTVYNSVIYDNSDASSQCGGNNSSPTISTHRPNIRFGRCMDDSTLIASVVWSPSTGLNDSTAIYPLASPAQPTLYNAQVTLKNGCVLNTSKLIKTSDMTVTGTPDSSYCGVNAIPLSVTATGSYPPFTYQWYSPNAVIAPPGVASVNAAINSLGVIPFYATVTDSMGCVITDTMLQEFDPNCYNFLEGRVYDLLDGVCGYSPGFDLPMVNVLLENSQGRFTFSKTNGTYSMVFNSPGPHTITQHMPPMYDPLCPSMASRQVNFAPGNNDTISGVDYGNFHVASQADLYITAVILPINIPYFAAWPNDSADFRITYGNRGIRAVKPHIEIPLNVPADQIWVMQSNLAPHYQSYNYNQNTGIITLVLDSVFPGESGTVDLGIFYQGGLQNLVSTGWATIYPLSNDFNAGDNITSFGWPGYPYDPNMKVVAPAGEGPEGYILQEDTLHHYTIHFQNVGNAPAQNVIIRDTLDTDLDLRTFVAGGSSHPYTMDIVGDSVLIFQFMGINLPDSLSDPLGSRGYVDFSIEHNSGVSIGTRITNSAGIFFDSNLPVVTNTVINTIALPDSIPNGINEISMMVGVFPNPASDQLTVQCNSHMSGLRVYDVVGNQLMVEQLDGMPQTLLNTSTLSNGVYILVVEGEDGNMASTRFTITR